MPPRGPRICCAPKQKLEDMPPSSRVAVLFASHPAYGIWRPRFGTGSHGVVTVCGDHRHVTATFDHAQLRHLPVGRRDERSAPSLGLTAATLLDRGSAVALRQRPTILLGALAERAMLTGDRLVTASDVDGHSWWLPAAAVWSDADCPDVPEHPRPIGLATAPTREAALLKGISDRLGWEAAARVRTGRGPPCGARIRRHVDWAGDCPRWSPRACRADGGRPRRRHDAVGCRSDLGGGVAPGPVRRRPGHRSEHRARQGRRAARRRRSGGGRRRPRHAAPEHGGRGPLVSPTCRRRRLGTFVGRATSGLRVWRRRLLVCRLLHREVSAAPRSRIEVQTKNHRRHPISPRGAIWAARNPVTP